MLVLLVCSSVLAAVDDSLVGLMGGISSALQAVHIDFITPNQLPPGVSRIHRYVIG